MLRAEIEHTEVNALLNLLIKLEVLSLGSCSFKSVLFGLLSLLHSI